MIKVSVIIPVFHVEKYLRKCLDSIVRQTLQDIEIILVNDASPDGCADIMKEYAAKDSRIKCIYLTENHMMGGARNKGVEIAKGEYITFVDSDDYLEVTMLEKLYDKAIITDSDMVYCTYHYTREDGSIIKDVYLFPPEFDGELTIGKKKGIINKLAYPWGKLFRTSIWKSENIQFPEDIIYEDGPTIPLAILYMKRCSFVEEALYYYVLHNQSAMNKRNSFRHLDTQKSAFIFKKRMEERGLYEQFREETDFYFLIRYYKNMIEICLKFYDVVPINIMTDTRNFIRKHYQDYRQNPYYLTLTGEERMLLQMNDINPRLAVWWYKNRSLIMRHIGRKREGIFYYKKYYVQRRERLLRLLYRYQDKKTGIWGAGLKKAALLISLGSHDQNLVRFDIIDNSKDKITGKEVLFNEIQDDVEVIFVVNPSFYFSINNLVKQSGKMIELINMEDYLNGFIDI